jgi:hypothetical protein
VSSACRRRSPLQLHMKRRQVVLHIHRSTCLIHRQRQQCQQQSCRTHHFGSLGL